MSIQEKETCVLLPHHEQHDLCTTRLPYRQGRKLTAVKVYTVTKESKHILIFGVPSLSLRRETKELFMRYGNLIQFNITKHPSEDFTETYHALYESIHSARTAKKMLDNKNYYGGCLHVCYAPELETVEETKEKLLSRRSHVLGRIRNLQRDEDLVSNVVSSTIDERAIDTTTVCHNNTVNVVKMYMGSENTITFGKRKHQDDTPTKKVKHIVKDIKFEISNDSNNDLRNIVTNSNSRNIVSTPNEGKTTASNINETDDIEIIDFTSAQNNVVSNINEALNYNKFGCELIKKIPHKPVNKIKFNINKK